MSEFEPSNLMRESSPEIIDGLITFAEKGKRLREWVGMELSTDVNPLKYGQFALKAATDLSLTFAQNVFAINGHFKEDWKAQKLISNVWYQDDQKRVNYFTHLMGGDLFKALGRESIEYMVEEAFREHAGNVQNCTEDLHSSYSNMLAADMSALLNGAFRTDERRVRRMTRDLPLASPESTHSAMSWTYFSELSKGYGNVVLTGILKKQRDSSD